MQFMCYTLYEYLACIFSSRAILNGQNDTFSGGENDKNSVALLDTLDSNNLLEIKDSTLLGLKHYPVVKIWNFG
jgi:hypothetical protein